VTVQQYMKTHPEPFFQFLRRSLASLGYKDLAPGRYALSLRLTILRPGGSSVTVTTGCAQFDVAQ